MSDLIPEAFHAGEQAVQARLGVRERMAERGSKVIRDYMPDQHRDFFSLLPTLFIAARDGSGQPWASLVTGQPGFVQAQDERHLDVDAWPDADDPITPCLIEGAAFGVLGLQFTTRRRNRLNGRLQLKGARSGFSVAVDQSFGNCPKYIQTRALTLAVNDGAIISATSSTALAAADQALIAASDTFFIASASAGNDPDRRHGLDMSHRGGPPGFVRIEDEGRLSFPDYRGNLFYNTLGNMSENPRVGLLFLDFTNGDIVQLAGRAEIEWQASMAEAVPAIERRITVTIEQVVRRRPRQLLRGTLLEAAGEFTPKRS